MAKSLHDWAVTDASNNFAVPDGAPEGWAPGSMNNHARAAMGVLARYDRDNDGSLATATSNTAYTVALNQVNIAAWYDGLKWRARIHSTSGATPTINPTPSGGSALGAKSLYWPDGTQVTTGHLRQDGVYDFAYKSAADKVYVLSGGGAPSASLLTSRGDLLTRDASNPVRLAVGAANTALVTDGTDPSWAKINGTHLRMGSDAQGDVLYFNGTNYVRLGAGTNGHFLKTQGAGANPVWASAAGLAEGISGHIETPTAKTYYIIHRSLRAGTLDSIYGKGASGTTTLTVRINGVSVTFDNTQSFTSAGQTFTAQSGNTIAVGDEVTFVVSAAGTEFRWTLNFSWT